MLYLPYGTSDSNSKYSSASALPSGQGNEFFALRADLDAGAVTVVESPVRAAFQIGGTVSPTSIAVPIIHPAYNNVAIESTDFMVIGGKGSGVSGTPVVARGSLLVKPTGTLAALREIRTLAFSGGRVYRLNGGAAATAVNDDSGVLFNYSEVLNYFQACERLRSYLLF